MKPMHFLLCLLTVGAYAQISLATSPSEAEAILERYEKLPLAFEAASNLSQGEVKYFSKGIDYQVFLTSQEARVQLQVPSGKNQSQSDVRFNEVRLRPVGGQRRAVLVPEEVQSATSHYFLGNDRQHWRTNVPQYGKVRYASVYPGIDLVYYGQGRQLEYDWIVAPYKNPQKIQMKFEGVSNIRITQAGDLILSTPAGHMVQHKPVMYQTIHGKRRMVKGKYIRTGSHTIGFRVGHYDKSQTLVIDPVLGHGTYLGGQDPVQAKVIKSDADGNFYVAGSIFWTTGRGNNDFPLTDNALYKKRLSKAANRPIYGFVSKYNADGTLIYSSYVGSTSLSTGIYALALDAKKQIYVAGYTYSPLFYPVTDNALQKEKGALEGTTWDAIRYRTAMVTKISADGQKLLYSSYMGGRGDDVVYDMVVDADEQIYLTGYTHSPTNSSKPDAKFPVHGPFAWEPNDFDGTGQYAFAVKLTKPQDTEDYTYAFSTYVGGEGSDIARALRVDENGYIYIAGGTYSADFNAITPETAYQSHHGGVAVDPDNKPNTMGHSNAFFTLFDPQGKVVYGTFIGGPGHDEATSMALSKQGHLFIAGTMASSAFPMSSHAYQKKPKGGDKSGFVMAFAPSHPLNKAAFADEAVSWKRLYGTYVSGSKTDEVQAIGVDNEGHAYVTGHTSSNDFADAIRIAVPQSEGQPTPQASKHLQDEPLEEAPLEDVFVVKLNPDGSDSLYGALVSGDKNDRALGMDVTPEGLVYVTGWTESSNFPTLHAFQEHNNSEKNAFIFRIDPGSEPLQIKLKRDPESDVVPFGHRLRFTASVTGLSKRGGSVEFKDTFQDTEVSLGTLALGSKGYAVYETDSLAVGTHRMTAIYQAKEGDPSAKQDTVTYQIVAIPTNVALDLPKDAVKGQDIFIKAVVKAVDSQITPTGSVEFFEGKTSLGQVDLDSQGEATYQANTLAAGEYTITATYKPNTDHHVSSTVSSEPWSIAKAASHVSLDLSASSVMVGQVVKLTATVKGANPMGSVTFQDGKDVLGSVDLVKGQAVYKVKNSAVGQHSFVATYAGDANNKKSHSEAQVLEVAKASPRVVLSSSHPDTPSMGIPITFTAEVQDGFQIQEGKVVFTHGQDKPYQASVGKDGKATYALVVFNNPGTHIIVANYVEDANNTPTQGQKGREGVWEQKIGKYIPELKLTSSSPSIQEGQEVTLTATVKGADPQGTVSFTLGAFLKRDVPLKDGKATLSTSELPVGTHKIVALYTGDERNEQQSQELTQTVVKAGTPQPPKDGPDTPDDSEPTTPPDRQTPSPQPAKPAPPSKSGGCAATGSVGDTILPTLMVSLFAYGMACRPRRLKKQRLVCATHQQP